jgi:HD-GYP domain-containing protein (c-di-GMP phosphodiesterase class II)
MTLAATRTALVDAQGSIQWSAAIAALSSALDLAEGLPEGHAVRSCRIGMRLAEEIGLGYAQRPALFYALLLKDLGGSSNAARIAALLGADDRALKHEMRLMDWPRHSQSLRCLARSVLPKGTPVERAVRLAGIGLQGPTGARQLVAARCQRGAELARLLALPEETAAAIGALEEHWDGRGYPRGLQGEEIPLAARVCGLAQSAELFFTRSGVDAACDMVWERRARWFDPTLADALLALRGETAFWEGLSRTDLAGVLPSLELEEAPLPIDDSRLDRLVEVFGRVADAKSPWTHAHSEQVALLAMGTGEQLGFSRTELRDLRRAALLHDLGKLAISNRVLDKPGNLTSAEREEIRRHPLVTQRILARADGFQTLAAWTGAHHERLDGRGYPLGLSADQLSPGGRVLAVAEVCEALLSERPYRPPLRHERVIEILRREAGVALCSDACRALESWLGAQPSAVSDQPSVKGGLRFS